MQAVSPSHSRVGSSRSLTRVGSSRVTHACGRLARVTHACGEQPGHSRVRASSTTGLLMSFLLLALRLTEKTETL